MAERCGDCIYLDLSDKREGSTILGGSYLEYYCKDCGKYKQVTDRCSYFREDKSNQGSGSGCFITTVVVEKCHFNDQTSRMLNVLRMFRSKINRNYDDLLKMYDVIGPKIAEHLRQEPTEFAYRIYDEKLMPIAYAILNEDDERAIGLYVMLVREFEKKYGINEDINDYEYDIDSIKGHGKARMHKRNVN